MSRFLVQQAALPLGTMAVLGILIEVCENYLDGNSLLG